MHIFVISGSKSILLDIPFSFIAIPVLATILDTKFKCQSGIFDNNFYHRKLKSNLKPIFLAKFQENPMKITAVTVTSFLRQFGRYDVIVTVKFLKIWQ